MTAAEQRDIREGAARFGVELGVEAIERLTRFLDLLQIWNRRFRLTGDRDRRVIIHRHVLDAIAIVPRLEASGLVVDIGSGAGFPGLVVACVRPDLEVVLIEARRRPVSFLAAAIRTVPLERARVDHRRAEEAARDPALAGAATVAVARALRLEAFLGLAAPFLSPDGLAIAMQTPRTSPTVAAPLALAAGLDLVDVHDYRLPAGEPRRLLVFARRGDRPASRGRS